MMAFSWLKNPKAWIFFPLLIALALVIACGDDDQSSSGSSSGTSAVPTAVPAATDVPPPAPPSGTLRIIIEAYGQAAWTPETQAAGMTGVSDTTFAETLWVKTPAPDNQFAGQLLESWSISPDNTVWTLNLQKNVPFHFGYGEFTVDDVLFNWETAVKEGTTVGRAGILKKLYFAEGGGATKVDDYTLTVDSVVPKFDFAAEITSATASGMGMGMLSKAYYDAIGPESAPYTQAVGTGPWRSRSFGQGVWLFDAMPDHWRKTPNFAELDYREIAEESTRLANYETGNADTVQLSLESINTLRANPANKFMEIDAGGHLWINMWGNQYEPPVADHIAPVDCTVPWVSCDPDMASVAWENARKVREALNISIDRDLLVETLVDGNGSPSSHYDWLGFGGQMGSLADLTYDFDPARARQLLADAGYADGFAIEFALVPRPYAGTIEAGEAIAVMWEDIGITNTQFDAPLSGFRSHFFDRDWVGFSTHASGISGDPASKVGGCLWSMCDGFNYGWSHPVTSAMILEISNTFDDTERFAKMRELSTFFFEQSVTIPTMNVATVWPVSPRIEPWDFWCCAAIVPSRLEYVEHSGN
jgi:peptide/nickel transport system substrate-binding protein